MMSERTIGIDIDGVLADHVGMLNHVALSRGLPGLNLAPDNYSLVGNGMFATSKDYIDTEHELAVNGLFAEMIPIDDNIPEQMDRLLTVNDDVLFITARKGYHDYSTERIRHDTERWLRHALGVASPRVIMSGNKGRHGTHTFIDDAPHNLVDIASSGQRAIGRLHKYNRATISQLDIEGVASFSEFVDIIESERSSCYSLLS